MHVVMYTLIKLVRREHRAYFYLRVYGIAIIFIFAYAIHSLVFLKNNIQYNHILSAPVQLNHFTYYPASRSDEEMRVIDISDSNRISNHFHKYDLPSIDSSLLKSSFIEKKPLPYSEELFQDVNFPVLWLDSFGDIHWNAAAEKEMHTHLMVKQFPPLRQASSSKLSSEVYIRDCQLRQLLILEQWRNGGFLSRLNCLIEQFGQSLYTPTMAVLSPRQFGVNGSAEEDFLEEGIVGYIASISRCSAYLNHPSMSDIKEAIHKIISDIPQQTKYLRIETFQHLQQRSNLSLVYLPEIWKFGYEHVPHRRWLFDFDREHAADSVKYGSLKTTLTQHNKEHIYLAPNLKFNFSSWEPNNSPFYQPSVNFQLDYIITWKDKVFTAFIRYMITLYIHHFLPRIHFSTQLLTLHWTTYLGDKYRKPYNSTLEEMAAIFIRRGDKMPEDSFWKVHKHWRNVSYYVKGLVDEENRRNKKFSSIFIMTDDASVMNSILEYASTKSNSSDEAYARRVLYGRQILYNVFAPQSCFDPFKRIGFDQFLVSLNFLVEHASFIVSHTDSNVGRYLERIIYARRQIMGKKTFQTTDFIKNAPDSFD